MNNDLHAADVSRWRACAPGELAEVATQHRRRQQRRAFLSGLCVAVAGCAAAGMVGILGLPRKKKEFAPSALACDEVARLLPAYIAQQLDERLAAQVQQHLATCEHCTARLRQLRQASSSWQPRPLVT
jgi:hypothetical protein